MDIAVDGGGAAVDAGAQEADPLNAIAIFKTFSLPSLSYFFYVLCFLSCAPRRRISLDSDDQRRLAAPGTWRDPPSPAEPAKAKRGGIKSKADLMTDPCDFSNHFFTVAVALFFNSVRTKQDAAPVPTPVPGRRFRPEGAHQLGPVRRHRCDATRRCAEAHGEGPSRLRAASTQSPSPIRGGLGSCARPSPRRLLRSCARPSPRRLHITNNDAEGRPCPSMPWPDKLGGDSDPAPGPGSGPVPPNPSKSR